MMDTRRDFIRKASLLAGATALVNILPESIQQALAIEAPAGSTYLDAEHIVFLMQENRSFDHSYGAMRGVRGFNDPRAMKLPNGLPVWIQSSKEGESCGPFRLDIENTKTTWMGSLPHGWGDMVHARNEGKMDTWLDAKRPGNKEYKQLPLTMGFHNRQDIPFYYAFADAFTICDQHFCSSLTGTTANRSYFWTGTVREEPRNPDAVAHLDNGQFIYKDVRWKTYPERLQEAGVDWKVYQNELSIPMGFTAEEDDWLANFTNNNLEFHKQYGVRFHPARRSFRNVRIAEIENLIAANDLDPETEKKLNTELSSLKQEHSAFTAANYDKLSAVEKEIHERGLSTNTGDPHYHELETITYEDEEGNKSVQVPKGDILHQFRKDVNEGKLPTVSWLVAPGKFSDHPGLPWYGAWYVSETLNILTQNPEVWKKTIFILTYDENDGYFDHVSPYVPPHTDRKAAGAVASGIDTKDEYVTTEQEKVRTDDPEATLDSPIGLGFRVPMVIASPWSKGGWVNSEVFDHTSTIQFLEHFIEKKQGKKVIETNIGDWRRLVCGNLTSAFRPVSENRVPYVEPLNRNEYVERIYSARNKDVPDNYHLLTHSELEQIKKEGLPTALSTLQEPGTKPACAIPYDAQVNASLNRQRSALVISFELNGKLPKTKTVGIPYIVISRSAYGERKELGRTWNFAVREGEPLSYSWPLDQFENSQYHLEVYGPNGFYREFKGNKGIELELRQTEGGVGLRYKGAEPIVVKHASYQNKGHVVELTPGKELFISLENSFGWYDLEITTPTDASFYHRYAGHIETGRSSQTDPLMGRVS